MSFSLLFSWTLVEYCGREGSLEDFLLVRKVDLSLQAVFLQGTYRFFFKGGWVVIHVRQRNGRRGSSAQTIRFAVQVGHLNWDQVCCFTLKGMFDATR